MACHDGLGYVNGEIARIHEELAKMDGIKRAKGILISDS